MPALLVLLFLPFLLQAQGLQSDTCVLYAGQTPISLIHWGTNRSTHLCFVALHDNENTCVEEILPLLKHRPGRFVELQAEGKRMINYQAKAKAKKYPFDPNRIFTKSEHAILLNALGMAPELALKRKKEYQPIANALQPLGEDLFEALRNPRLVVSLHNNYHQPGKKSYNIAWYMQGGAEAKQAQTVHINPERAASDFFVVTHPFYFHALAAKGFQVVLQSALPDDDGSLSVYCARLGIPYINIEAAHGNNEEQREMLLALYEILCEEGLVCCDGDLDGG